MKIEMQRDLFNRYPRAFRLGDNAPLDFWGIQCGEGWLSLIERGAAAIEAECVALEAKGEAQHHWPRVAQVKEKFGKLSFYIDSGADMFDGWRELMMDLSALSAQTCEACGQPGTLYQAAWWHTYCDACESDYNRPDRERQPSSYGDPDQYLVQLRRMLAERQP